MAYGGDYDSDDYRYDQDSYGGYDEEDYDPPPPSDNDDDYQEEDGMKIHTIILHTDLSSIALYRVK